MIFPSEDENPGGTEEKIRLEQYLQIRLEKESDMDQDFENDLDPFENKQPEIDQEYNTLSKELDDGLRILQASIGTK